MEVSELKHKVEALLFSSGKKMMINEIAALTRTSPENVKDALNQLQNDYEAKESSLMIIEENDFWKITVKEKHLELVRNIVSKTELSKTVMETLATIAWKAPCLQSVIIKIRTNKAYEHIKLLEEDGYISKTKQGRTQLIRLSQKFYDYFDIPHEKIKEVFSRFRTLEKQIEEKEKQAEDVRDKIKVIEEEHKKQKEAMKKMEAKGIEIDEDNFTEQEKIAKDLIKEEQKEIPEESKEKIGNFEVIEYQSSNKKEKEQDKESSSNEDMTIETANERLGRQLPDHIEKKVDKRVKEIIQTEKETKEESQEDKQ